MSYMWHEGNYILVYHIHIYFMYLSNLSVYPRLILKILSRFQNYSSIKSVSSVLNVEDLQMRILPWWWDRRIRIMYSDKRIYNLTVNSALQRSLKFQRSTLRRLLQYLLKPQLYLSSYNISLVPMSPKTSAISLQLQSILKPQLYLSSYNISSNLSYIFLVTISPQTSSIFL